MIGGSHMKRTFLIFTIAALTSLTFLTQCGPSEQEKREMEQARQDSIEAAQADSIAQAERQAKMERQQELERQRKEEQERKEREARRIEYDENGNFTVQTEAWRSLDQAQKKLTVWKERGAEQAFIVKHGNEATGDIWFRVRLGKYATQQMAEKHAKLVMTDFNTKTWITTVKESDKVITPE